MCTTLHYSFSTKACGPTNLFKVVLASSKVTLTTFTAPWKFQVAHELVANQ